MLRDLARFSGVSLYSSLGHELSRGRSEKIDDVAVLAAAPASEVVADIDLVVPVEDDGDDGVFVDEQDVVDDENANADG